MVVGDRSDGQIAQLLVVRAVYGLCHFRLRDWAKLAIARFADAVVDKLLSTRRDRGDCEGVVKASRRYQTALTGRGRQFGRRRVARSQSFHVQLVELFLQVVIVDSKLGRLIAENRD